MAKKLELHPGEAVIADTHRYSLQGKKVKFPVRSRCVITDRRFIHFHLGKMAPFYLQLGFLIKLMVKGKPNYLPLDGMKVSRGKYFKNTNVLQLQAQDGSTVLLDKFDKSLQWLKDSLQSSGVGLSMNGEEEWQVQL